MADPAVYFPVEVCDGIFDYATNRNRDARSLASCCRVNRNWNSRARPLLYSRWTYHGEKHSIRSLWKFLCTAIRDDSIAALVQAIDLRNWSSPSESLHLDFEILQEELLLVRQAFRAAKIEEMDESVMNDIKHGYREPIMALLFTRLSNLRTMSAHLPHYDAFLGSVLQGALANETERPTMQAFQELEELSLVSEWERPYWQNSLELVFYAPVFNLPRLRRLSLFNVDVEEALHHCGPRPRTSSIQHLTLVNDQYTKATAPETQAILRMPTALNSLTFYQNDCGHCPPPQPDEAIAISNAQLFTSLEGHMKSLEYLDIYRDCTGMTPQQHSDGISHFGLLQGFERLKILCIHPETLLGGNGDDPRAPFRLKDTLPTSLESLTFYGTSGLLIDLELESQFREVLQGGNFPNLKCVTFEDVSEFVHYYIPSYVKRPNQAVKALCYEARVNFFERKFRHFPKGGKQQPWYMNAMRMRRFRERKVDIMTDDGYSPKDNVSDTETDVTQKWKLPIISVTSKLSRP